MKAFSFASAISLALLLGTVATPAVAAMPADGEAVPPVPALQSVSGGQAAPFDLAKASTGSTVVLYFFPQAFSEG